MALPPPQPVRFLHGPTTTYFQDGIPLPPCSFGGDNYTSIAAFMGSLNASEPITAAYIDLAKAAIDYERTGGRCVSIKGLPDVRLAVTYIILYTSLCTVLFMLLTTILLKGGLESAKRRSPIVWLLAASILLGLVASVFDTVFWTVQMVNARIPASAYDGLYVVEDLMLFIVPWVVVWALIMRLAVFWPAHLFGRRKQFLIILPPAIFQCATLACYGVVLCLVHKVDGQRREAISWSQTATAVLGENATPERLRWEHAHYATSVAALAYVNFGLSRQWLRLRSSRGNGLLAQMRRWIGLGPDPVLRLAPSTAATMTSTARLEDARLLRTLRPQRRVGVWWTLVRILHFIAFGFWVPTGLSVANWVVFSKEKLEVSMYLAVSLMYVFPVAGILACLGATSRFFDRENHYYPSQTNTMHSSLRRSDHELADSNTDPDPDLARDLEAQVPPMAELHYPAPPATARRRQTAHDMISLADFLGQGPGPDSAPAHGFHDPSSLPVSHPQPAPRAPSVFPQHFSFSLAPTAQAPVQSGSYERRPSGPPSSKLVTDSSASDT